MRKYNWINAKGNHGYRRVSQTSQRGTYTYINRSGNKKTLCLEIYKIKLYLKRILKSDYSSFRNKNTLQTEIRWFHDAQMDILWAWRNSSYKLQQGLHHKV